MRNERVSATCLFHYTKRIDNIISIIQNGFYPMTAIEDLSFMMPNYTECKVGIPMVCFTDLTIDLAKEHRNKYGLYGIGLKKEWGIKKGINPINYVVKGSGLYNSYNHLQAVALDQTLKLSNDNDKSEEVMKLMIAFMDYAGYLKEYSANYYDEREWRYLPPFKDEDQNIISGYCNRLLPDLITNEEIEKLNKHMKQHYTLKFDIDDIEYIVLPSNESASDFFHKAALIFDTKEIRVLEEKTVIREI